MRRRYTQTDSGPSEGRVNKDNSIGYWTAVEMKSFKERKANEAAFLCAESEDGGTIVGTGKAAVVTNTDKDAAIQGNLDAQEKVLQTSGGTDKRVTGELSQFTQTNEDQFGSS